MNWVRMLPALGIQDLFGKIIAECEYAKFFFFCTHIICSRSTLISFNLKANLGQRFSKAAARSVQLNINN